MSPLDLAWYARTLGFITWLLGMLAGWALITESRWFPASVLLFLGWGLYTLVVLSYLTWGRD